MERNRLKGKRTCYLLRSSTKLQDMSVEDQRGILDDYSNNRQLVKVGEKAVPGLSGSIPAKRKDLKDLLERARHKEFDVLLVHDLARFTRSGVRYAYHIEWLFEQEGVEVVSATDNIPDGPAGDFYKTYKHQANRDAVQRTVHDSTRTMGEMIKKGLLPHCQKPPFGTDRLYLSRDGVEKFVIRNLSDGRQQKLSPDGKTVIEEYAKKMSHQKRHLKQDDDIVVLVKGAPERVNAVRHMYRRHFVDGLGSKRIALELTEMGIATPTGQPRWSEASVYALLTNPTFTALGIANLESKAWYFRRPSKTAKDPLQTHHDAKVFMEAENLPRTYRAKDEWLQREYSDLQDFLPPDIKVAVRKKQLALLERRSLGISTDVSRDKHVDSAFILKGVLRSKQGDCPMSGQVSCPRKKTYRYYKLWKGSNAIHRGKGLNKCIPAEPIEKEVLTCLQQVVNDLDGLRERARRLAIQRVVTATSQADQREGLVEEQKSIQMKLNFIIDNFNGKAKDAVAKKIADLQERLFAVERRIEVLDTDEKPSDIDIDAVADSVVAQVRRLREGLATGCYHSIRKLIALLISRLEVDLDTKQVDIEFRLPDWSVRKGVLLDHELGFGPTDEAHTSGGLKISSYTCEYRMKYNHRCFQCRRLAAA